MNELARSHWERALAALRSAERLVSDDPDGSASRAYYAAFHAVNTLFAAEGLSFTRHAQVESAVHRDLVRTHRLAKDTGAAFSWLVSARYKGDYGSTVHVTPEEAQQAVARARHIVAEIRRLKHGDLPGQ